MHNGACANAEHRNACFLELERLVKTRFKFYMILDEMVSLLSGSLLMKKILRVAWIM